MPSSFSIGPERMTMSVSKSGQINVGSKMT